MRSSPFGGDFSLELVDDRPGLIVFRCTNPNALQTFGDEAGGHRWQRVPVTEKRGRVQTSTVTVAVLAEPEESQLRLDPRDLTVTTCRGSGPGGQHRNVTDSAVQVKHLPTGLIVRCDSERSQAQNRASAMALLRARLWAAQTERADGERADERRRQVGSGMRGDKRRTIRVQDGQVHDHVTGRRWNIREYLKGQW